MFLSCQIGKNFKKVVVKNHAYQVTACTVYEVFKCFDRSVNLADKYCVKLILYKY